MVCGPFHMGPIQAELLRRCARNSWRTLDDLLMIRSVKGRQGQCRNGKNGLIHGLKGWPGKRFCRRP